MKTVLSIVGALIVWNVVKMTATSQLDVVEHMLIILISLMFKANIDRRMDAGD